MLSSIACLKKFGIPGFASREGKYMEVLSLPAWLRAAIPALPVKVYCNRLLSAPLVAALSNVVNRGLASELKTWNGCYIVRKKRGAFALSLHSWGVAVDLNAGTNVFGKSPTLSAGFVKCFTDAGFDWGGEWKKPDGMHFQLSKI